MEHAVLILRPLPCLIVFFKCNRLDYNMCACNRLDYMCACNRLDYNYVCMLIYIHMLCICLLTLGVLNLCCVSVAPRSVIKHKSKFARYWPLSLYGRIHKFLMLQEKYTILLKILLWTMHVLFSLLTLSQFQSKHVGFSSTHRITCTQPALLFQYMHKFVIE